ncbi:hypothetical protein BO78DRAFT_392729 [Aspergillus sclerotiicarbonarius CBS 121057]|uniref:Secreted protein n=1 Tax=Aspergillus sclerotiicarbonarius (strain CBS 121057 / IBT 28362) TaxID=1448318 RepID=A0A319ENX7_ASPSB|nr:hypothetical protein BO78DRAFT_392729 [Aspergillus sclerotiicarbonarius CBS 121057]
MAAAGMHLWTWLGLCLAGRGGCRSTDQPWPRSILQSSCRILLGLSDCAGLIQFSGNGRIRQPRCVPVSVSSNRQPDPDRITLDDRTDTLDVRF